jgi:hypothetical protein
MAVSRAHQALARIELGRRRCAEAHEHARLGLDAGRRSGEHRMLTGSLVLLGCIELARNQPAAAKAYFDEAVDAFTRLGTAHSNYMIGVWLGLGWVVLAEGDLAQARQRFEQVVEGQGAAAWEIMDAKAGVAAVLLKEGQQAAAAELLHEVRHAPETAASTRTYAATLLDGMATRAEGKVDMEDIAHSP